jgi:DNA-binding transcriptional ArsR family regulator
MEISPSVDSVFGGRTAGQVMLFLEYYGEAHCNQIARAFGVAPSAVYKQLKRFESGGLIVARSVGRTSVFTWNPRNRTSKNLRLFLAAELESLPETVIDRYFRERNRPRATGKRVDYVSETGR